MIFGWLTIFLFSAVGLQAIYNASLMYRQEYGHCVRIWMTVTHALILLSSSLYVHLQVEWMLDGLSEAIGEEVDIEWLIFETFVACTFMGFLQFSRIYVKYPITHNPAPYKRRVTDDTCDE